MIKLKTDCTDCIHSITCRYAHNARFAMDKLKKEVFTSDVSNDFCTWDDKMAHDHVDIEFSCPDFVRKHQINLREVALVSDPFNDECSFSIVKGEIE